MATVADVTAYLNCWAKWRVGSTGVGRSRPLEQLLQVSARELPWERLGEPFVVALEGVQAHGESRKGGEVVVLECLALEHGEVVDLEVGHGAAGRRRCTMWNGGGGSEPTRPLHDSGAVPVEGPAQAPRDRGGGVGLGIE